MPPPLSPGSSPPPSSPSLPPRTPSPERELPSSPLHYCETPVKKPRVEVVYGGNEQGLPVSYSPQSSPPPCSAPSSPPTQSPPTSPPACSPQSSPLRSQESTPVKEPRWKVFSFRTDAGQASQAARSTLRRWEACGLRNTDPDPDEVIDKTTNHQAEDGEEQQHTVDAVGDNEFWGVNTQDEEMYHDSSSDFPCDSSDSEGPPSESSEVEDNNVVEELGEQWYDSEEEMLNEESDEETEDVPLYRTCPFSREEAMLDLLDDFLNNKETQKSLKDHLATFIKYLPSNHTMPKSIYLLFKYLKDLAPTYVETTHYYCKKCLYYAKEIDTPCRSCGENKFGEFYMIDLEIQIKFYFEHCNLAAIMDDYDSVCKKRSLGGGISDICDGTEYIRVKVDKKYSITLMWNTDGVAKSKSSKASLYPILAVICEIPPRLRSKFLIVAGVWCDSVAPPMNTLLRPFCENLVSIESQSGVQWIHPHTGKEYQSMVTAPLACADAPVRAQIQNITSHNGKHACNTCEQKTTKLPLTNRQLQEKAAGNKKIRRKRRFCFENPGARERSSKRMGKQAKKAFLAGKSVRGVRGASVVRIVPRLDVSTCVFGEYMHGVCLGIVKYFLDMWINVPGPWNMANNIDQIDEMLLNINPPNNINRIPREASGFAKWKASEFRSWLLFFSLIICESFLPPIYFQHWMCFVLAINNLLQETISEHALEESQILLDSFVKDIGRLYGPLAYVYNVHQCVHLPTYVRRWGNLWATSAFLFEDFNGILSDIIHGTKNRAKELINLLRVSHGVEILRERVRNKHSLGLNVKAKNIELLTKAKKNFALSDADQEFILSKGFHLPLQVYAQISVQKERFTSLLYHREQRRVNYCVGFDLNGFIHYGEVKFFICKGESTDTFALIKVFTVEHVRFFVHNATRKMVKHIIPVKDSDKIVLANVNSLFKVMRVGSFICRFPNPNETKL